MLAKLPVVFGINTKTRLGRVRQIAEPSITIDCKAVKYTLGKSAGHVIRDDADANLLYLFASRPTTASLPNDAPVLFAKGVLVGEGDLDLTDGTWVTHAALAALPAAARAVAARSSWRRAFQFAEEDPLSAASLASESRRSGPCMRFMRTGPLAARVPQW